jgi:transcriptional regulator with XRE-family HTH domain
MNLRRQHGWSQTELAKKLAAQGLPFHQQTVQRIEQGTRPLRLTEAAYVADTFGLGINQLLDLLDVPESATAYRSGFADGVGAAVDALNTLRETCL